MRRPPAGHDLAAVDDAVLDLAPAHGPAVDDWLATGEQQLSALARDVDVRSAWAERLRRLRWRVAELADLGHPAGCLVLGVARVDGELLPVLVRPCRVRVSGPHDARLELTGPWRVDPVLAARLAGRSPRAAQELAATATDDDSGERSPGAADPVRPRPDDRLDRVVAVLGTAGLPVDRRLCLAPLGVAPDRAAADLGRVASWAGGHRVLDTLRLPGESPDLAPGGNADGPDPDPAAAPGSAGSETAALGTAAPHIAVPGTVSPGAAGSGAAGPGAAGPESSAPVVDAALDDLLAAPLDPHQRGVLRLVLAGRHVAADAAPATGATHVAAAVAALAAATGRRCLVLAPTVTLGDVLEARTRSLGIRSHVVRGADPADPPREEPSSPAGPEAGAHRAAAAERFAAARGALDVIRDPWQVSRLDVLDALARLDAAPAAPVLEWPVRDGPRLPLESVHRVVDAVAEAVRLGALAPGTDRGAWSEAQLTDPAAAAEAASLAHAVAGRLGDAVRAAAAGLAQVTGTAVATTRADLAERLRLFAGLQATLDKLRPEVFDVPVDDLVAATGGREFRAVQGVQMAAMTRRRLVGRARRLLRPGIDVPLPDLHALLVSAARQRAEWQSLSGGAGWAHVPPEVPQRLRAVREFLDACRRLGAVHPGVRAVDGVDEVIALAGELARASAEVAALPERTRLRQVWLSRGLGELVDRLADELTRTAPDREADPGTVARTALWRAWWAAAARATNPPPGSSGSGVRALEQYAAAHAEHRRAAAGRAAAAAGGVPAPVLVRIAVPADLAELPDDERFDVLVVDDAGTVPFAEVVGAVARSVQVVAVGDLARAVPASALAVLRTAPVSVVQRPVLGMRHRPVPVPMAAGGGPGGPEEAPLADPGAALSFTHVAGAAGLPAAGDDHVDSSQAEVRAVVDLVLETADEQWRQEPPGSLAVVALTRSHAAALAAGLRTALRARPDLVPPFTADRAEPVVVISADQARGLERDVVVLSVGFPRTPHGRVLHRFGPLDGDAGAALVVAAVTRARSRVHVVSGLRSGDLDPSRLRGAGAQALSALLAGAELVAGRAAGAAPAPEPVLPPGGDPLAFPRRGGTADGSWVRHLVVADLAERGLAVAPGPDGQGLTVAGPIGPPVVVDLDVQFADAGEAAAREARLAEGGWRRTVVAVEDVAALRTATAHALQAFVSGPPDSPGPGAAPTGRRRARPDRSRDPAPEDSDVGWSERSPDPDERLTAERPPHW